MKRTTVILPDHLVRELKRRAVKEGRTLSAVATELLRRGLKSRLAGELRPLPVYDLGHPTVDITDRDALYRVMEDG